MKSCLLASLLLFPSIALGDVIDTSDYPEDYRNNAYYEVDVETNEITCDLVFDPTPVSGYDCINNVPYSFIEVTICEKTECAAFEADPTKVRYVKIDPDKVDLIIKEKWNKE